MKLHELVSGEVSHAERVQTGRDRFKLEASMPELQARAKKFEASYEDSDDVYWKLKNQLLTVISNDRDVSMYAALWPETIKTKDDLELQFFDKVYPFLEKAGFPQPVTKEMQKVFYDFSDWMRK